VTVTGQPGPQPTQRETAVDGLRALALLPVIAINWVGYASLPDGGPLGAPQPPDSWWAQGTMVAIIALLAGKGVSLLSFLFGYSQALSRRARGALHGLSVRRRRMQRLLILGLLHGLLIYAGDILTTYAVCGLLMLHWSGLRLRQLKRRLIVLVTLDLLLTLLPAAWFMLNGDPSAPESMRSLAAPAGWAAWLSLNAGHYLLMQIGTVLLGLPLPLSLMTAGLIAARLRLFTHARWRASLGRWARRWLGLALLVNLVWGLGLCLVLLNQDRDREAVYSVLAIYPALLLLIGVVPWLLLRGRGLLRLMAPAGRHTLSMYLCSSLVSLLCLSGAGLALPLGTVASAFLCLLYWGGWLILAPLLGPQRRLPLEAWLDR